MDINTLDSTLFVLKQTVHIGHMPRYWRGIRDYIFNMNDLFVYPVGYTHNLAPRFDMCALSGTCIIPLDTKRKVFCSDYGRIDAPVGGDYEIYFNFLINNQVVWISDIVLLHVAEVK